MRLGDRVSSHLRPGERPAVQAAADSISIVDEKLTVISVMDPRRPVSKINSYSTSDNRNIDARQRSMRWLGAPAVQLNLQSCNMSVQAYWRQL